MNRTVSDKLGRTDFLILSVLSQEQATSKITAMTTQEIIDSGVNIKRTTVNKYLHNLIDLEYVQECGKAGRAITYCITNKGREFLKEMWNNGNN